MLTCNFCNKDFRLCDTAITNNDYSKVVCDDCAEKYKGTDKLRDFVKTLWEE